MSKARDLADLGAVTSRLDTVGASDGALSNRNLIINGNFDIWQRGTSASISTSSDTYLADRWTTVTGPNQTATVSRQEFADGQTDVPQSRYFHRIVLGSGTDYVHFDTRLEETTFRPLSGTTVTLTFYAKASAATVMGFEFAHKINVSEEIHGGQDNVFTGAGNGFSLTTAWQKFTLTHTFPSYAGKTFDTSAKLSIRFVPSSSTSLQSRWGGDVFTSGTIDIAQVQLEVGDTATPFEHRSYGDELARCKRYLQRWDYTTNDRIPMNGGWDGGLYKELVPEMRSSPTISYQYLEVRDDKNSAITITSTGGNSQAVYFIHGTTANGGGGTLRHNYAGSYLNFDAEL